MSSSPPIVHLRAGRVQPIWSGHPWVYAQAIARIDGSPTAGDEVSVRDPQGRFVGRGYYSPNSAIPVRILTREEGPPLDGRFLAARIADAVAWREDLLVLPNDETDGFRLINAEGDNLSGLVVDAFDESVVVQFLTAGMKRRQREIVTALREVANATSVFEATSPRHQKIEGIDAVPGLIDGEKRESLTFHERGFTYEIPAPGVAGTQKTGYYFDQRETRAMIEGIAAERTVLDAYCFLGGFSLAAARGGAADVLSIDSSAQALDRAAQAARRAELHGRIRQLRSDAVSAFEELHTEGKHFDLVICDPPKLAPSARELDEARAHYRKVNALAIKLVEPGGLLLTCSCSQAMGGGEFLRVISAAARSVGRELIALRMLGQPPDHPTPAAFSEGRYLKCVLARVT